MSVKATQRHRSLFFRLCCLQRSRYGRRNKLLIQITPLRKSNFAERLERAGDVQRVILARPAGDQNVISDKTLTLKKNKAPFCHDAYLKGASVSDCKKTIAIWLCHNASSNGWRLRTIALACIARFLSRHNSIFF